MNLREAKQMSILQLSKEIHCNPKTISFYENGDRPMTAEVLKKYSEFFGVSTDYLLGLTEIKTTDKDVQYICEHIGLSDESVQCLHEMHISHCENELGFLDSLFSYAYGGYVELLSYVSGYKEYLEIYKMRQEHLIQRIVFDCPSVLQTEKLPLVLYDKHYAEFEECCQAKRDVRLSYFDTIERFKKDVDFFARQDSEEIERLEKMLHEVFFINNPHLRGENNGND